MDKKIVVPMKRSDRVEDFIPYIENVARPGMKVVFMVPYPMDGLRWSAEEFGTKAITDGKRLAGYYTWDASQKKANARVAQASAALQPKGIEVTADLYTGSIRSAVHEYTAKGDVHLIVTRAGVGQKIAGLCNGSSSLFDLFKRPSESPMLLIQPGAAA